MPLGQEAWRKLLPRPVEETLSGQAILERRTVHVPDVAAIQGQLAPWMRAVVEQMGEYFVYVAKDSVFKISPDSLKKMDKKE